MSVEYLGLSAFIVGQFAEFCEQQASAHPWLLRKQYLAQRAGQRARQSFSVSYLDAHRRQLRCFLRWYAAQVQAGDVCPGELTPGRLDAWWATQPAAPDYRRTILARHLRPLLLWLEHQPFQPVLQIEPLLDGYFEERRLALRSNGYGIKATHRAGIVTRRHLVWLEHQGHLPAGTMKQGAPWSGAATAVGHGTDDPQTLLDHFLARVDPGLPRALRQPLVEYLEHLVRERELVKSSIRSSLRTNLALCRTLVAADCDSFARLRARHLDDVVSSLVSGPQHDVLRRRRQVQAHNSRLRGFLRYLHQRNLLGRDLVPGLISPPCYRASSPPGVLSEKQVHDLLGSVDRHQPAGRRSYAILMLITTCGLRPIDVSQLRLDDVHWREQRISLVQKKTGRVLALPLLPQVAAALYDYLRHDRLPGLVDRRIFTSLVWPHQPVSSNAIRRIVARALADCGLSRAGARHLRASVATHLLRQGEAFSTIQEVLGHRTANTTQRYAVMDLEILRLVLEETER